MALVDKLEEEKKQENAHVLFHFPFFVRYLLLLLSHFNDDRSIKSN